MKKVKKFLSAIFILTMLAVIPAAAKDVAEERSGSIHVCLTDGEEGSQKQGIEFQCIKAASLEDGEYILTGMFKDSGIDLNHMDFADEIDTAAKRLAGYDVSGISQKTDSNGEAVFENLESGVYLIKAANSEKYDLISPLLVSVPMWDEMKKEMQYDVTVIPKHAPQKETDIPTTGVQENIAFYLVCIGCCAVIAASQIRSRK